MDNKFLNNRFLLILIILIVFYLYFNRVPNRYISNLPNNIIVSPCDGLVTHSNGRNISVFLSLFDVHAQYVPINSTIKNIQIIHGMKYMAFKPESKHNEGIKVTFSCIYGDLEVTQRVGFFVRRIKNYIKVGDNVERGYNYGKINFGSRVDILLPYGMVSKLKTNTRVSGGLTILH